MLFNGIMSNEELQLKNLLEIVQSFSFKLFIHCKKILTLRAERINSINSKDHTK